MSAGVIVRHSCGRLVIDGQRCVCQPVIPYRCDCTARGNDEHEGDHCHEMRRQAWARVFAHRPAAVGGEG